MKDTFKRRKELWIIAIIFPMALFLYIFPDYLVKHTFFWVCLISLPISIIKVDNRRFPFFICCLVIASIGLFLPTTIGIYVYVCAMVLYLAQRMLGSIHVIGLIHIFLASPFFTYISKLISFPIRIQLSKIVSSLLNFTGYSSQVKGNVITLNGVEFLVDQACSGMYLLGYGILFGTLILSIRIRKKNVSIKLLFTYYTGLLSLIIWGNIVRIYILVISNIGPTHWMHEAIGLLIFAVQVLIPFYLLVNGRLKGSEPRTSTQTISPFPKIQYASLAALLGLMIFIVMQQKQSTDSFQLNSLCGYKVEHPSKDVVKLTNSQSLIYIKKPVSAYDADHNPLICWSGSGYSFKEVETLSVKDTPINVATLRKGDDILYSSWWFESHKSKTSNQWDWRWKAITNQEKFFLVNITCNTKDQLKSQVENLLSESIISENFITENHDI